MLPASVSDGVLDQYVTALIGRWRDSFLKTPTCLAMPGFLVSHSILLRVHLFRNSRKGSFTRSFALHQTLDVLGVDDLHELLTCRLTVTLLHFQVDVCVANDLEDLIGY